MSLIEFSNAQPTTVPLLAGERLSLRRFRLSSDDPDDWGPACSRAIAAAIDAGGKEIKVPANLNPYRIKTQVVFPADAENIYFVGEGDASTFVRYDDLGNDALFEVLGKSCGFYGIRIDGNTTSSVGLKYGPIASGGDFDDDPMHSSLTSNSTIWIKAGARNFYFEESQITQTGGYAILADAEDGDIDGILIRSSVFVDNVPHLFGVTGDLNYGSWTGGIFLRGDCRTSTSKLGRVRKARVVNCRFENCTGNQAWQHSKGFDSHHEDFEVEDSIFDTIGRDGTLHGNCRGGKVRGCTFRRIGYIDFGSGPIPKALAGAYAVAIDTSGWASDVRYEGNRFYSVYGGCLDLDGFRDGDVVGNVDDGTLEGAPGTVIHVGVNLGDTQNNGAGRRVRIQDNTFRGCEQAAIRLNYAVDCLVSGNLIEHPSGADEVPIQIWTDDAARLSTGNVVTSNRIVYDGASVCVIETGSALDNAAVQNFVYGNLISGTNTGEFGKLPNTKSFAGHQQSSVLALRTLTDAAPGENSFTSDVALIRRNSGGSIQVSTSVSAGARVWTSFGSALQNPGEATPNWALRITRASESDWSTEWNFASELKIRGRESSTTGGWFSLGALYYPTVGALPDNFAFAPIWIKSSSDQAFQVFEPGTPNAYGGATARVFNATESRAGFSGLQVNTDKFKAEGDGKVTGLWFTATRTGGSNVAFDAGSGAFQVLVDGGVIGRVFNATATGSAIGLQVNGGQFQVDGNGNASGAGNANFTGGYIGGSFRGGGVAVQSNGIGGGSVSIWNGTAYGTILSYVSGQYRVAGDVLFEGGQSLVDRYAAISHSHAWADITGKPSTFPPESHNHDSLYYQKSETYTKAEVDGNSFAALSDHLDAYHPSGAVAGTVAGGSDSDSNGTTTVSVSISSTGVPTVTVT